MNKFMAGLMTLIGIAAIVLALNMRAETAGATPVHKKQLPAGWVSIGNNVRATRQTIFGLDCVIFDKGTAEGGVSLTSTCNFPKEP